MRSSLCCSVMVVFLTLAGCGPVKPGPSGAVYEGKHVSEWGDAVLGPDREERVEAAKTIVRFGKEGVKGHEAIQALHKELKEDDDPIVRGWCAVALTYASRGTPFPVAQVTRRTLEQAAESPDEELRTAASEVLQRMQASRGGRSGGGPGGPPGGKKQEGKDGPPAEKKQKPDEDKESPAKGKKQERADDSSKEREAEKKQKSEEDKGKPSQPSDKKQDGSSDSSTGKKAAPAEGKDKADRP
jgi:hypothetical protein